MAVIKRAYLSIEEIAKEYLPMSRKKIRELVIKNLPYRKMVEEYMLQEMLLRNG